MDSADEKQVDDGLVEGYVIWHPTDKSCHDYPSYPVMEWYPGRTGSAWCAALLEGHPYAAELKALAGLAGYMPDSHYDPKEFSECFTFPKEWMEGVKDVRPRRK